MKQRSGQTPMQDLRGYLTNEEMDRLEEAAKHMKCRPDRYYMLIRMLRVTGRRISEILALKPSDIDFTAGQIMWGILKKRRTDKPGEPVMRLKWIDSKTLKELSIYIRHHQIQPDERVFTFTRNTAHSIIRRVGKKAGIEIVGSKGIHVHCFRHSFAVNYLRKHKGSSQALRELQGLLEHSSMDMTAVYLQFSAEDTRTNYEAAIDDIQEDIERKPTFAMVDEEDMEEKENDSKLETPASGSDNNVADKQAVAATGI